MGSGGPALPWARHLLPPAPKLATLKPMEPTGAPQAQTLPEERLPFSPGVGCLLSLLAGLAGAGAFAFLLWFNQQGQIVHAPEPYRATRIWILRGAEGSGLGASITRPMAGATEDDVCAATTVSFYFLGGGMPEANTEYCECFTRTDSGWTLAGDCPE